MSDSNLAPVHLSGLFNFMRTDSLQCPISNAESRRSIAIFVLELFELHWSLLTSKMMKNRCFDRKWSSFHCLLLVPPVKFSFHFTWYWCKIWQAFRICHRFFSILSSWRARLQILVNFDDIFTGAQTSASAYTRCRIVRNRCYIASDAVFEALSIGGSPAENSPKMTEKRRKYWKDRFFAILAYDHGDPQMSMRITPFRLTFKS
jgi:hypothetical protein